MGYFRSTGRESGTDRQWQNAHWNTQGDIALLYIVQASTSPTSEARTRSSLGRGSQRRSSSHMRRSSAKRLRKPWATVPSSLCSARAGTSSVPSSSECQVSSSGRVISPERSMTSGRGLRIMALGSALTRFPTQSTLKHPASEWYAHAPRWRLTVRTSQALPR